MTPSENKDKQQPRAIGWMCSGLLTPRDAANLRRFNFWTIGMALSYVGSTFAIVKEGIPSFVGYALTALTLVLGIGAIRSYIHFLRQSDELLRKIHLDAIAIGFGSGVVFLLMWRLLELLGAPEMHGSIAASVLLIMWAVGQRIGIGRYAEEL